MTLEQVILINKMFNTMIEYDSAYGFHPANVKSISLHICSGEISSAKKDLLQINADAF